MDKETFVKHVLNLAKTQQIGYQLDNLFGVDISCEGFIGDLISDYGDLLLAAAASGRPVPDEIYEAFWNVIVNAETDDVILIEEIYEELSNL